MPTPGKNRVFDIRREGDGNLRRLIACKPSAIGIRINADRGNRSAEERKVTRDRGYACTCYLRIGRNGKSGKDAETTTTDAQAGVGGGYSAVPGCQIVKRMSPTFGGVPFNHDGMGGKA